MSIKNNNSPIGVSHQILEVISWGLFALYHIVLYNVNRYLGYHNLNQNERTKITMNEIENNDRWLTIKEAQERYKCERGYVIGLARKASALVDVGTGNRPWYRVDKVKLDEYLSGRQATLEYLASSYPHRLPIARD